MSVGVVVVQQRYRLHEECSRGEAGSSGRSGSKGRVAGNEMINNGRRACCRLILHDLTLEVITVAY